jgi:adenosine deaminase CECR1
MMKGLFNYESAYRAYLNLLLADFARDNVQWAEIRPNFMKTNQLWTDDGAATIDNVGIMEIITSTTEDFVRANPDSPFCGLKIIYCTPRILDASNAEHALAECIAFKQRWPDWIAGFDLIGEEAAGRPLKYFAPALLAFRARCAELGLDIPLLLHCGESVDAGSDADGNILDALLLGAKRIGHGFALPRHPYVMEQMKARGVCVELCPISNEILGLTPRVGGHAMYTLLANNVHCTVSSDNGTLFK